MDKEQTIELLEHLAWDKDNEGNCYGEALQMAIDALRQPEIVHCKDCVKHNQSYGNNGTIDSCPLVLYRGKAQGHEFDYQYCAFAERKTNGENLPE